jgi:hypothetical protein
MAAEIVSILGVTFSLTLFMMISIGNEYDLEKA